MPDINHKLKVNNMTRIQINLLCTLIFVLGGLAGYFFNSSNGSGLLGYALLAKIPIEILSSVLGNKKSTQQEGGSV